MLVKRHYSKKGMQYLPPNVVNIETSQFDSKQISSPLFASKNGDGDQSVW